MLDHLKKAIYDKGIKGPMESEHTSRLLEKEEVAIIAVFTAIVIVALLVTYLF